MEEWKDIKGYEGLYQVSNDGRVKSLPKTWTCGRYGTVRHNDEKIMKLCNNGEGYLRVNLSKNGKTKWYSVHRLVGEAFIPNPYNLSEINHKNECTTDNSIENLEWCDRLYNMNYGTRITKISKPVEAFDDNGNVVYSFESMREARRNGFADANVLACIKGILEKAYKLKWRYKKEDDN